MFEQQKLSDEIKDFSTNKVIVNEQAPISTLSDYKVFSDYETALKYGYEKEYLDYERQQTSRRIIEGEQAKDPTLGDIVWDSLGQGFNHIKNIPSGGISFLGHILVSVGAEEIGNKVIQYGDSKYIPYESDVPEKARETLTYAIGSNVPQFAGSFGAGAIAKAAAMKRALPLNIANKRATAVATGVGTSAELSGASLENRAYELEQGMEYVNQMNAWVGSQNILLKTGIAYLGERLGYGGTFRYTKQSKAGIAKGIGISAASEGVGEGLTEYGQTWADEVAGRIDIDQLNEEYSKSVVAFIIGAMFGSTVKSFEAITHKQRAFSIIDNVYGGTIPEADKKQAYEAIFNQSVAEIQQTLVEEALLSEEVKTEHNALERAIYTSIRKQIRDAGAFKDVSESELAQVVGVWSRQFSDIALSEAIHRKLPLSVVVNATDVIYEDGEIYLKGKYFKTPSTKLRLSTKGKNNDEVVVPDEGDVYQPEQENKQQQPQISAEQSVKDSQKLPDVEGLKFNYDIDTVANRDIALQVFNEIIPENERANYIDSEGFILPAGIVRVQQAMLGKVLDEVDLLQQVISSQDQDIKNISKALTDMVGRIDGLEKYTKKGKLRKGYTIKDDIKRAVRKLVKAKLEGKSLSDIDMVDLTPAQQELVKSFSGAKSVRQIKNAILQYTNAVGTVARNQKFAKLKPIAPKEEILKTQRLYQEQVALADEMNELDRTNEEYTAETININGKERPVYNSEGNRIAKSEKALRAFYEWFGDSKVVDEQGRPLVVYHGTNAEFDTFMGTKTLNSSEGVGFNFAVDKDIAKGFGEVMSVYLNLENPVYAYSDIDLVNDTYEDDFESENQDAIRNAVFSVKDKLEEKGYNFYSEVYDFLGYLAERKQTQEILDGLLDLGGYIEEDYDSEVLYNDIRKAEIEAFGIDGYVTKNYNGSGKAVYIAFSPNQIKSVDNRGTFDINNPNIYYQTGVKEIDSSELYNRLPKDLKDAVDFIFTAEPVYNITGNEFPDDGTDLKSRVLSFFKNEYNNVIKDTPVGDVLIDDRAYRSTKAHGLSNIKVNAFKAVPNVLKNGKLVRTQKQYNGKPENRYLFVAPVSVVDKNGNNLDYFAEVIVREGISKDNNGKRRLYIHEVELKNKLADVFTTSYNTSTPASSKSIISKLIADVNSDGKLYQKAYVSMKGELVGDYLDADRFGGTGEGAMVHGWGNYLLKDRETNKVYYYDWMSQDKIYYKGSEVGKEDDLSIRFAAREFAYSESVDEAKKAIEKGLDDTKSGIEKVKKQIKEIAKKWGVSQEEVELLKQLKDVRDSFYELSIIDPSGTKLTQQEVESKLSENAKSSQNLFYSAFENLDIYTRRYNAYKEALELDLNEFEKKKTGAQYEAEVPENKYLLDEDKFLNKQSKVVRDAINEIAQEMGNRFNEAKLRKLTNDKYSGSGSENWKTYYGKRAFFLGKQRALEYIHNDQEGTLEQELTDFINNLDFNDISDPRDFNDYTGREIYQELDNYYGSQKRVSKLLEKHGIKGIKYDGERDGIGYVIFKGADAPITRRLLQRAYAASRVDYERPSLKYIGTGEGNQAHGWGLYYALRREIAEAYREGFTKDAVKVLIGETSIEDLVNSYEWNNDDFYVSGNIIDDIKWHLGKIKHFETKGSKNSEARRLILSTIDSYVQDFSKNRNNDEFFEKRRKQNLKNISDLRKKIATYSANEFDFVQEQGQVHEVDIPEMPYLMDEDETFFGQPKIVQDALTNIVNELTDKQIAKEFSGTEYPENRKALLNMWKFKDYDFINTGRGIYKSLSTMLGSDKAASLMLAKHGVKGITYEGMLDGRCFVIFNPNDVNVIDKFYQVTKAEGIDLNVDTQNGELGIDESVWQSEKDNKEMVIKGYYDHVKKSIGITKHADFSTLPHEFSHFWFDNMWSYVESGEASPEYIEKFEAVKKFVGLKDGERPTDKHHEKFARAYEKRLLTGAVPNSKVATVFDDYEKWIRKVYASVEEVDEKYGEKYEPLTQEMYDFFNSMVSTQLPKPKHFAEDIEANKVMAQKVDEDVDAVIEEEINTIEERAGNYIKMPVQTDNKTGYLTAYNKVTGENVTAGSATLKVEEERAREFVLNNPQQAYDIVMGFAPKPEGYISNLIYKAYIDLQKQLGNTKHRAEVTINKALELRSEGQDISSEQLETDFVKPTNVISTVINRKTDKVAKRNNKTRKELSDYVKKEVRKAWYEGKKPEEIVKKLADKLTVKPREAKLVKSNNDTYAFKNLLKYVEDSLGMGMSTEEAIEIIRIADDMNTNLKNSMSETGNPSIEYFIKLRELENYVNKLAPSSVWRVLVSVIGRGNLLASLKSPVTNIVSTLPTNIFMAGTRRLVLGVNTSIVDPKLVKQARKEAWEIYKQTGYHLFSMEDVTKGTRGILGENLSHSQGEGAIRALGRFYEKLIYDFSLGRPDVMFKNFTFTDYASLKATKLSGGDKKKANELFEDACRVEPLTDEGKEIRKEAVNEALVATYQNNGALSETLLKARDVFSFGVGFGEFIAPFVKTPANIVETSVNMAFGVPRAIISETVRSIQRGEITAWTSQNIRYCVENGLGVLLAIAVASLLDDDDYMPAYALASNRDKELARELNIPYNSVRLGDTWYSLDYLGVLAAPLVSVLQARKSEDIMGAMWNYGKGGLLQATTIPVLGSISDIVDNIERTLKKEGEEVAEDMLTGTIEGLYSRTVPMIVSDIAKALDPYEREKSGFGVQQNIPFAREELPKKVSITSGEAEKLGNPFIDLFAGARIKEQVRNDVADELKRLNDAGFGVILKDVTKGTKFSDLDEETKQEVRVRYAEEYSERVSDLINSDSYQELEDDEKSQAIGKIRTRIMKELREEFL